VQFVFEGIEMLIKLKPIQNTDKRNL